ncbi:MAG: U32 family peptidase [Succinivibrio sp.]
MRTIELLAPAKNKECAIAAIDSGADAVYIGGPSFGARVNAGNSLEDIEAVCSYAHLFKAKVHVTINTILSDSELEKARELAFQLYDIGVDALIIQDLGLINGSLPPLEIHASTQQDNSTLEKVQFLEKAGFSQVVLARELSINEIREISQNTSVKLEAFIHGALCVGISGRCYLSAAITGRSANRGECAQLCRVPMSLINADGQYLAKDRYLLSMRDLNQSDNIEELIDAGISSFKIEGRLKDVNYVKNVTAYYRKAIDEIIAKRTDLKRSSFGRTDTVFAPDVSKSFNRGFTEYNTHEIKENYANFDAPGYVGLKIGKLEKQNGHDLTFKLFRNVSLHNGDSLNYYNKEGELEGFRISSVKNQNTAEIFQDLKKIPSGTIFFRSKDSDFEKQLEGKATTRKLSIRLIYSESENSISLNAVDECGIEVSVTRNLDDLQTAKDPLKLEDNLKDKLGRLGDTIYRLDELSLELPYHHFVPQSVLNSLRRSVIEKLNKVKTDFRADVQHDFSNAPNLPEKERNLGFMANIFNEKAAEFYKSHGTEDLIWAYETERKHQKSCVLTSKHCLRYCFNLCPKRHKAKAQDLYLEIGKTKFKLDFDCKNCLMKLIGPL